MEDYILAFNSQMLMSMGLQFLNTLILCYALAKILYNPVRKFMATRTEKINNQILSAQTQLSDADKLKKDYEMKIKNIESERTKILESANKHAAEKGQKIIFDAEKEAQTLKNRAMQDIEREKNKARDEIKKQMVEIASLMASQYISSKIDEKTQHNLLNKAITDLGDVKWLS